MSVIYHMYYMYSRMAYVRSRKVGGSGILGLKLAFRSINGIPARISHSNPKFYMDVVGIGSRYLYPTQDRQKQDQGPADVGAGS